MIGHARKTGALLLTLGLAACSGVNNEVILPGERIDVRPELAERNAVSTNVSAPISLGSAVSRARWTHTGGSSTHNAGHNAFTSGVPSLAWTQKIGKGNSRKLRLVSAPVGSNGVVASFDSLATVTVVSASSGAPVWSRDLTPASEKKGDATGGSLIIAGDKLLASTAYGEVIAMDLATGAELWRQNIESAGASGLTAHDGLVYVLGSNGQLRTITIDDGRIDWTISGFDTTTSRVGAPAPAVNDRLAVLPFASGEIHGVFRKGGTQLWTTSLAGQRPGVVYANVSDITADPVIVGNVAYVGNQAGRFAAIDMESGTRLWAAPEGAYSPAAVVGGSAFIVTDRAELLRLSASTGERIWGVQLPFFTTDKLKKRKAVFANYGPVAAGGKLWVASSDGALRGFSPQSGALLTQVSLPSGAASDPIFIGGVMYVLLEDGELAALR